MSHRIDGNDEEAAFVAPNAVPALDADIHPFANRLLSLLPHQDRAVLELHLQEVSLEERQVLETPHIVVSYVYFLTTGMASVVASAEPNHRLEVGMVGSEGMTGLTVVLGDDQSANLTMVQSAGTALRVSTHFLRRAMTERPLLAARLLRYVHAFMAQASQSALANGRGSLSERLARWLLMWQDRVETPVFSVTHEFLSLLLGVRRTGVTVTLHELEGRGLIRSTRGRVEVLDRKGLRCAANGFYGVAELEYERIMDRRQLKLYPSL